MEISPVLSIGFGCHSPFHSGIIFLPILGHRTGMFISFAQPPFARQSKTHAYYAVSQASVPQDDLPIVIAARHFGA